MAFLIDDNRGSTSARQALEQALTAHPGGRAYAIDAKAVRNAASRFDVNAVPTVLRVRRSRTIDKLVGLLNLK